MQNEKLIEEFWKMIMYDNRVFENGDVDIDELDVKYKDIVWYVFKNLLSHNVVLDMFCHTLYSEECSMAQYVEEELNHYNSETKASVKLANVIKIALEKQGLKPEIIIKKGSVQVKTDGSKSDVLASIDSIKREKNEK